jgi:hypothetical protein
MYGGLALFRGNDLSLQKVLSNSLKEQPAQAATLTQARKSKSPPVKARNSHREKLSEIRSNNIGPSRGLLIAFVHKEIRHKAQISDIENPSASNAVLDRALEYGGI